MFGILLIVYKRFAADASSSFLPVHVNSLATTVYDLNTNKVIATGDTENFVIPHKANQPLTLPVTFLYTAVNASDTTCECGRMSGGWDQRGAGRRRGGRE